MPNRKSHNKKRTPKQESPNRLNRSSGLSKADHQEFEAETASPMPSREASVDRSEASSNGDVQDLEHVDPEQDQIREAVRNPIKNHYRMVSGRRYCLLAMIHEATHRGCRALPKPMLNPASFADEP